MNLPASRVLLVEDDLKMPELLSALLQGVNIALSYAANAADARRLVRDTHFDLIVLDLGLPDINGFELLRQFKDTPETRSIPVVILTALSSLKDKLRGFELGATDYMTKSFEAGELRARICAALRTKRLHDELIQANRELMAARVAAETAARTKADFLANLSHEIRTPMNGVTAITGLLLETQLTHEQRGYAETIHSSSEALLTIINDILDFSKIESGKFDLENRPLDLRLCIEESLDLLAPKAVEKKLDLACQMDEGIPARVLGDVTRLRQVLVNLLNNGIKFTEKGEIVTQVKILSAPEPGSDTNPAWQLHFSIRDTGIGVPADRLDQLFRPFTQADASTARYHGGTGLDLAISKRLVELMGGKMWAESVPGKGSTFHFTLPVQAAPETGRSPLDGTQPQLADLRLLIVDDNPAHCRMLTQQTSKWGMIPRSAQNAQQALEWLRAGEQFDLAILDMQMPDMDGLMLAGEIRKLPGAKNMPLVLLASMGVSADHPAFAAAAFASCLTKPIKPAQLHEVLVCVVSGLKPAAKKEPAPTKLDPALASRLPLRVLLCDDNTVNQKVALRLFRQMGYQPDTAGNGVEALAALERQPYDMIFMDIMMPEMDGLQATRTIRERQRDRAKHPNYKSPIIVIAMTAHAMQGDREACLAAGLDDYLAKPVRPEDVRAVVERWGARAASTEPSPAPELPPAAVEPPAQAAVPVSPAEEPPVDMERLMDFTDGNPENLRELVTLYINQTSEQVGQLETAARTNQIQEVRRVAHSCAGASATCGMKKMVPLLRELERQGYEGKLTNATELCEQVGKEFDRVRNFLAPYYQDTPANLTAQT